MHRDETIQRYHDEVGEALVTTDDYHWPDGRPPEDPQSIGSGERLDIRGALQHALRLENAACDYYAAIAGQTADATVQELAQTFAEEETEHVAALERWIARLDTPA